MKTPPGDPTPFSSGEMLASPAVPPVLQVVYALHDFEAENPDELSFAAGEAIEVTEKDDQYEDGWWQGRNTKGDFGLFPQSYTTGDTPVSVPPLSNTLAPLPADSQQPATANLSNSDGAHPDSCTDSGGVLRAPTIDPDSAPMLDEGPGAPLASSMTASAPMHETLTDVQNAIDQLQLQPSTSTTSQPPSRPLSKHGSRPASMVSHRSRESLGFSDDGEAIGSGSWAAGDARKARALLAQKARAEAEADARAKEARERERERAVVHVPEVGEIELSDESDGDDDSLHSHPALQHHISRGFGGAAEAAAVSSSSGHPGTPIASVDTSSGGTGASTSNDASATASASASANGTFLHDVAEEKDEETGEHERLAAQPPSPHDVNIESSTSITAAGGPGMPGFAAAASALGVTTSLAPPLGSGRPGPDASGQTPLTGLGSESGPLTVVTPDSIGSPSDANPDNPHIANRDWDEDRARALATPDTLGHLTVGAQGGERQGALEAIMGSAVAGVALGGLAAATVARVAGQHPQQHLPQPPPASGAAMHHHHRSQSAVSAGSGIFSSQQVQHPPTVPLHASAYTDASSRTSSLLREGSTRATTMDGDPTSPTSAKFPGLVAAPRSADPNDWTVEQVVDWGRSKGFDEFTLAKLGEHQISGDVLLELDMSTLKEIDLAAFGRRVRVNKAIEELKHQRQGQAPSPGGALSSPLMAYYTPNTNLSARGSLLVSPVSLNLPVSPESPPRLGDQHSPTTLAAIGLSLGNGIAGVGREAQSGASEAVVPLGARLEHPRDSGFAQLDAAPDVRNPTRGAVPRERKGTQESRRLSGASWDSVKSSGGGAFNAPREAADVQSDGRSHAQTEAALKKRGKRGTHSKRPSTAVSTKSSSSIPPSPDAARGGKPRSSFLGSLRSRKPPPKEPFTTSPIDEMQSQKTAEHFGSRSSGSANPSHRFSTRIFPFAGPQPVSPNRGGKPNISSPIPADERGHVEVAAGRSKASRASNGSGSRLSHTNANAGPPPPSSAAQNPLEQIGVPDHSGWMRKRGEKYPTWKMRYFVLKGTNLYYLKSETESKIKGHIKLPGFRVIMDPDINPGRYSFKIVNDSRSPQEAHLFSFEDSKVIREWMKAIMKATIDRDWSAPVSSSCNVDTMPISEAQRMFPPPRPPSPASRTRVQKAHLPAHPDMLTEKDAAVLMSMSPSGSRIAGPSAEGGTRPEKSVRRKPASPSGQRGKGPNGGSALASGSSGAFFPPPNSDPQLLEWVNRHLPGGCRPATDLTASFSSGEIITRLVESLSGGHSGLTDEQFAAFDPREPLGNVEVLFSVFDFLNEHKITLDGYSLNDLIKGEPNKTRGFLENVRRRFDVDV